MSNFEPEGINLPVTWRKAYSCRFITKGPYTGWIAYQHLDGQWVTLHDLNPAIRKINEAAMREYSASLEEQLALAANNTAAADLAQEMECLRAEKDVEIERYRQAYELEHKMKCVALDDRDKARTRATELEAALTDFADAMESCHASDENYRQGYANLARLAAARDGDNAHHAQGDEE